ncbi:MAG: oligoendopeptidase F [Lachnoclostridium sp.]|jgi:oligoendopeptidase F|nr:oligoendopeptidase F [Lachnoclostridium sp.]
MKRSEQKTENCWRLEDLYETREEWEDDFKQLEESLPKLTAHLSHIGESADKLLAFLLLHDQCSMTAERLYVYANQKMHENMSDTKNQAPASRSESLMTKLNAAKAAFTPNLLHIGKQAVLEFIDELDELKNYRRYLMEFFRQEKHIRNDEIEEMLANVHEISGGASDIFSMFNNADVIFKSILDENGNTIHLTQGNFIVCMKNKNRNIRIAAFESIYEQYEKYKNTLSATYYANVKKEIFFAKARKYKNTLSYKLDDADIPIKVYKQLIHTVNKYLPVLHCYMATRKEALGLDELHMYDINVPIVDRTESKISFEEAKDMVKKGLRPLGEEYIALLQEGFDSGWIDIYENDGKRTGAYSWGAYGVHPYVLLNFQGNLNSVFTLAHEMGHALHSYYSDRENRYVDACYKIFVAEVASTCNEAILIHNLLAESKDKEEKKYLLNYFIEQFRGTLFRQTMFAEFEMSAHKSAEAGEVLTPDKLSSIYYDLNRKYYGDWVCLDSQIAIEWARIPHFYRSFYVYQYATGFSAAIAISKKILEGDREVLDGYMKFLKGGCTLPPIELLKLTGVDMESAKPVEDAMEMFAGLLKEFETL